MTSALWRSWLTPEEADSLADLEAAAHALRDRLQEVNRWRTALVHRACERRRRGAMPSEQVPSPIVRWRHNLSDRTLAEEGRAR